VGPEIQDFLKAPLAAIWAHQNHYFPCHINNRYINNYNPGALDERELLRSFHVGCFHHPPTSYLIRVNVSARERLDYIELEDVYLLG
jgi:hypothetical protein